MKTREALRAVLIIACYKKGANIWPLEFHGINMKRPSCLMHV